VVQKTCRGCYNKSEQTIRDKQSVVRNSCLKDLTRRDQIDRETDGNP